MKRRHFINGLTTLIAFASGLLPRTVKANTVEDPVALFIRFFKTATKFAPSANQVHWFKTFLQAEKGEVYCDWFQGPRQCGMTTFMLVLALYQSKVHCKDVYITPSDFGAGYMCNVRLGEMRWRLGKSIHDGKIEIGSVSAGKRFHFQFIMNDVAGLAKRCDKYSDSIYKFRTTEWTLNYKYVHTT